MKKILTYLILVVSIRFVHGQYFSGEIVYRTTIIPKEGVELDELVMMQHNRISKYIITSKRYQNAYYDGDEISYSYTYDNDTKRMYDYNREDPYITYRDSRIANTDYYGSLVHRDTTIEILNYKCFMVESESDWKKTFTYYSDDLKIDYESFDGHLVGNWYERLKEVDGCINLGSITEHKDHFSKTEVIEVDKRRVKAKEFDLPELPIAANYTVLTKPVKLLPPSSESIQCYQSKLAEASNIEGRAESHTSYVKFLVTKEGEMKYVSSINDDEFGLKEIAIKIVNGCGLSFSAGEIDGVKTDSETYFPVEFNIE